MDPSTSAIDKSVKFKSVLNTYTYIDTSAKENSRDQSKKQRHSVDLALMFFGDLEECKIDDSDKYDDEKDNVSSVTTDDNETDDEKSDGGGTSVSEGTASGQKDGISTATGGSRSSIVNERGSSAATATSDLMSRFYARLQELTETKEDDDRTTSNTDMATRNKDRMRIKTALRRLLNSRLFPDRVKEQKQLRESKGAGQTSQLDDGSSIAFTPGTATPMTIGSRSNTFSRQSRLNVEEFSIKQGTRGKVVFVGESSHLTASSTDTPERKQYPLENNGHVTGERKEEQLKTVAYYRRHPLAPLKTGGISRLYQPVRPPSRSRTSLSQASLQRDGIRGDKAFLQRLQNAQGVRENTRWSLPGEKGPENYSNNQRNGWRRERNPTSVWSYNMTKFPSATDGGQKSPAGPSSGTNDWLKEIDDLELRKLLEELYRDKKYMDKIIDTKEANETEEEICDRLQDGRDYLLTRAMFWKEKGPLPPRPPTTELGLRLQRERTMQSRATNERAKESRIEGALSRQTTGVSFSNQQEKSARITNQQETIISQRKTAASPSSDRQEKSTPSTHQQEKRPSLTKNHEKEVLRGDQDDKVAPPSKQEEKQPGSAAEYRWQSEESEQEKELPLEDENKGNQEIVDHSHNELTFNNTRTRKEDDSLQNHQNPNTGFSSTKHVEHQNRLPSAKNSERGRHLSAGKSDEVEMLKGAQQQQQKQQQQQQHKEPTYQDPSLQVMSSQEGQYQEPQDMELPQQEKHPENNQTATPVTGFQRDGSAKKNPEEPKENVFIIAK
ncbi:hypothetical protein ElyMa_004119400 [Elysia marginata]|uniref:Uncharacterized protein n=1 Tax=Elysia marginata TaxID=1093978 RepID=A0AAV4GC45_9GAST|nr:hypothetical protein ElyMa_004119400 [Elysia marginata]